MVSSDVASALTYATLLLVDAQKDITSSNILALTKAAGVNVDKTSAEVFAKYATPSLVESLITKMTTVGGGVAAGSAPAATATPAAAKEEEKKKESESEDDADAFGGLF
ncbi:hypothetical protein C9374_011944 [Naegleria lovaniensis]|uniref:60S acidic ribosomal protein P1 n=1 Tax=Naegleria lovaniensis TaxID=51637 RepID=A0AA88KCA1_NAELO|nr:uncharacterized protein C9374_011944 [Naegleria lovaniensis]KAG2373655.1 hypothetical protein C9374_011944 [Naegleria lovaniensis]